MIDEQEVETYLPSKPQFDILVSRQQVNLFLAGQGSGKTELSGVISGILIQDFPKQKGFIGANTHEQLSDSTMTRIRKVWAKMHGWSEWKPDNPKGQYIVDKRPPEHFSTEGHDFESYRGKICFRWGTVVFKGSLENYKAHDGKEFTWAILDETKDTKEEAVKEVITGRLREHGLYVDKDGNLCDHEKNKDGSENTSFNPLYIFTSPAKVPWINEWFNLDEYAKDIIEKIYDPDDYFIKDIGNKRVTISSVFHNAHNLPKTYIPNQLANLEPGRQDMLIYGNPFGSTGGEFYKQFNRRKNVIDVRTISGFNAGKRAYNPALPLHISFDFNVNPYMSCTIWQMVGKKVYQIDEICLENPNNTTYQVCKEFSMRYHDHIAGLFIYGDPAGKHEDTRVEKHDVKGYNDYLIISKQLVKFHPKLRVALSAPAVVARGNFINKIFIDTYEGIEIFIHENCKKSIADYVYLKEASDGLKLKEKVKNPETLVTYEKYGHTSDSGDYFICAAFVTEFSKFQRGGSAAAPVSTERAAPSKSSY